MDTTRQQFRAGFARQRVTRRDFVEVGPQTYRWWRIAVVDHYAMSEPVRDAVVYAFVGALDPLLFSPRTRLHMRRLGRPVRL